MESRVYYPDSGVKMNQTRWQRCPPLRPELRATIGEAMQAETAAKRERQPLQGAEFAAWRMSRIRERIRDRQARNATPITDREFAAWLKRPTPQEIPDEYLQDATVYG